MTGGAFVPSQEWIEALQAQATVGLVVRLQRYARRQALSVVEVVTRKGEIERYATKLLTDTLTRTLSGAVWWDPARHSLETHWIEAMQSQAGEDRAKMRSGDRAVLWSGEPSPLVVSDTDAEDTADMVPVQVANLAASMQLGRQDGQKMLQALRALVPSDQEIWGLLDDAQIHDAAIAELDGSPTPEEEHAARNVVQGIQGQLERQLEQLRRDAVGWRGRK
jgi:hypothetical protein